MLHRLRPDGFANPRLPVLPHNAAGLCCDAVRMAVASIINAIHLVSGSRDEHIEKVRYKFETSTR
jgi:hypothetical protein